MEDRVIREFKVIETEDGYRIEIKGDKEKLRPFVENMPLGRWFGGPGFGGPRGMRHLKRRMRHKMHMHGFGPHHHGPMGHHGEPPAWWYGPEEDTQADNPASRDVPPTNV